jgi:hypothetical protein
VTQEELLKYERREICRIHAKRLDDQDEKLERLCLSIYGNGGGAEERENSIEQMVRGNTKFINEIKQHWKKIVWVALSGAASAIILLIFNVAKLLVENGKL